MMNDPPRFPEHISVPGSVRYKLLPVSALRWYAQSPGLLPLTQPGTLRHQSTRPDKDHSEPFHKRKISLPLLLSALSTYHSICLSEGILFVAQAGLKLQA